MKGTRYSEEQIVRILGEAEGGQSRRRRASTGSRRELSTGGGRSSGGMEISEVRRLKELEAENVRLRRIVAQQAMDNDALKELLRGKW